MTEPLQLTYPELARVRTLTAWSELPYVVPELNLVRAVAGLEAWAVLDEGFGDPAGAAAHRRLARLLGEVSRVGVADAFLANAQRLRGEAPPEIVPALSRIDEALAELLGGDDSAGVRAEAAWVELAGSGLLEDLADPQRLSLLCDGIALHESAYAVTGNPTSVEQRRGLLEHTLSAFRSYDGFASQCRVHLDPRLSRISGSYGVALAADEPAKAHQLLQGTVAIIHPQAPDAVVWLYEAVALVERSTGERAGGEDLMASVVAAESPGSRLGERAWRWLVTTGLQHFLSDADRGHVDSVLAPGPGSTADRLLTLVEGDLGLPPTDDVVDLALVALGRLGEDTAVAGRAGRLSTLLADNAPQLDARRRLEVRIALLNAASRLAATAEAAAYTNDLAALLLTRFDAYGDVTDIQRAIDALEALDVNVLPPPQAAGTLGNLTTALRTRARLTGRVDDLDKAGDAAERGVVLTAAWPPEVRAAALSIRATVAHDRYNRDQDPAALEAAIVDWRIAEQTGAQDAAALVSYNLGNALLQREPPGEVDEALRLLEFAVLGLPRPSANAAFAANRLAEAVRQRAGEQAAASELRRAARWSEQAIAWAARTSNETLLRVAWDAGVRAEQDQDFTGAATSYAMVVDAVGGLVTGNQADQGRDTWLAEGFGAPTRAAANWIRAGNPDRAVLVLERGRGLLLRDALGLVPSYEETPTLAQIVASLGQPLLYLVPARDTGFAVLLDPSAGEPMRVLELPGLTESQLGGVAARFHQASAEASANVRGWRLALDRTLAWLKQTLEPAIRELVDAPLSVVPTGSLSFLPVHTAFGGRVVTLAPTAATLAAARAKAGREACASMLVIADPSPTTLAPLRFAAAEAGVATAYAENSVVLSGPDATADQLAARMAGFTALHLACHAVADVADPRASRLILANDQRLDLATLVALDMDSLRLVVLSACETGVPGAKAPDETLTLGTAFFGAGAEGVVSTLWQVADLATLVLVTCLYGFLAENLGPAESLARAQAVLRDGSRTEIEAHLTALTDVGRLPDETLTAVLDELGKRGDASGKPLSTPDYWAAFVFTGC
ncbi:MAG: CHAT domain-containing protein [Candidatus Nanopelagicales bacterium]